MSTKEYRFLTEIINDQDSSYIPDVAFSPDGSIFAVTYRDNDEVRIYDSTSLALLRTYKNPDSLLCFPHGIAITENHIIVSNKLNTYSVEPSILTVYRTDSPSSKPVLVFRTPHDHLREAHSLDVNNGRLVVTYAGTNEGAILTYHFDDDTGDISGPASIIEGFNRHVEPKGISFNEDGSKVFITITGEGNDAQQNYNCLAVFDIDKHGVLSKEPAQAIYKPTSRLENVNISGETCVVADAINNCVLIYHLNNENCFDNAPQIIQEHLAFPHDACLSPDKKLLVVTNNGIKVTGRGVHWGVFLQPRCDKITIFKLTD